MCVTRNDRNSSLDYSNSPERPLLPRPQHAGVGVITAVDLRRPPDFDQLPHRRQNDIAEGSFDDVVSAEHGSLADRRPRRPLVAAVVRKTSTHCACPEPVRGDRRRRDRASDVRRGDRPVSRRRDWRCFSRDAATSSETNELKENALPEKERFPRIEVCVVDVSG